MNKKIFSFLVIGLFVILTTSCDNSSSSKSEPKRETPQELSELEKASCEFKADEGGVAPTNAPASKMVKSHFQKSMDESLILPVLEANAMETVRFAKFSNLDIYSVNAMSQKSCKMLAFIPSAGSTERNIFTEIQNSKKDSTLLGLYFPPESKQFNGNNKTALMLVREDTTRWTLVHEYMHHLFSKEVHLIKRDIDLKADFEQEYANYEKAYEEYKKTGSNLSLFSIAKSFEKMIGFRIELLKRYTLEEITIETYLIAQHSAGKFKFVPRIELAGAKSYIKSNVEAAQEANTSLTELIDSSIKTLTSIIKNSPELAEEAKLIDSKVQVHKSDLAALMKEVSALERKNSYGFNEDLMKQTSSAKHQHVGCSHSSDSEAQASAMIDKAFADVQEILQ